MKIAIGCDHTAVSLKKEIINFLQAKGFEVEDFGTQSTESSNYPEYAEKVCKSIQNGEFKRGILICGTGVGISIAANKHKGIRCVVCSEPYSALLARQHNDSNVLAFGARVVGVEMAKMITDAWLQGEFEGGKHKIRVDMITDIENKQ